MALSAKVNKAAQKDLEVPCQYTEDEAHLYETIFLATEDHGSSIKGIIASLVKAGADKGGELLAGRPWSFRYLVDLYCSASYLDWKRDYLEVLRNQAELAAYRMLTEPKKLEKGAQTAVNAAIVIASGKLGGMDARMRNATRNNRRATNYEELSDGGLHHAILGDPEDEIPIKDDDE